MEAKIPRDELTAKMSSMNFEALGVSTDICADEEDDDDDGACFGDMASDSEKLLASYYYKCRCFNQKNLIWKEKSKKFIILF